MKEKRIYAKENFKINEYKIYVYDRALRKLYSEAVNNNCLILANPISIILTTNNKFDMSFAINSIIDYYPLNDDEKNLKEKILFCLMKKKMIKMLSLKRILLNLEYQFELNTAYHEFDDDIVFSEKINNIPYINSIRSK